MESASKKRVGYVKSDSVPETPMLTKLNNFFSQIQAGARTQTWPATVPKGKGKINVNLYSDLS